MRTVAKPSTTTPSGRDTSASTRRTTEGLSRRNMFASVAKLPGFFRLLRIWHATPITWKTRKSSNVPNAKRHFLQIKNWKNTGAQSECLLRSSGTLPCGWGKRRRPMMIFVRSARRKSEEILTTGGARHVVLHSAIYAGQIGPSTMWTTAMLSDYDYVKSSKKKLSIIII